MYILEGYNLSTPVVFSFVFMVSGLSMAWLWFLANASWRVPYEYCRRYGKRIYVTGMAVTTGYGAAPLDYVCYTYHGSEGDDLGADIKPPCQGMQTKFDGIPRTYKPGWAEFVETTIYNRFEQAERTYKLAWAIMDEHNTPKMVEMEFNLKPNRMWYFYSVCLCWLPLGIALCSLWALVTGLPNPFLWLLGAY